MTTPREDFALTLLPNGKVLAAGGRSGLGAGLLATAEIFDPATGNWTPTGSLRTPREGATTTLLPNGKVLSRLDRYRLVGHDPNWAATGLIHFHGETHGWIDGMDAAPTSLTSSPARWNSRLATERGAPRTGSRAMRTTKLSSDRPTRAGRACGLPRFGEGPRRELPRRGASDYEEL